jgi:TolA-binding protein
MRNFLLSFPIAFCLLLTACSGSTAEEAANGDLSATTGPFTPAAEALAAGEGPASVGGMLMQRFSAISNQETGVLDMAASSQFADVAEALAAKYPGDTLAALPLYRAAEVVRAMNDPKRAAAIYEKVATEYPGYSKAAESLFMLAFTYDEDLEDMEKAKATYLKFLETYPENGFADDTQMLLDNLGKSDEEILKDLEAKTKVEF